MRGSAGPITCSRRSGSERVEVLGLERALRLDRQARQVELHLGVEDRADLVPRRVDELVLVLADDLGAVAGRAAIARVQVQVGDPVVAELAARRPSAASGASRRTAAA